MGKEDKSGDNTDDGLIIPVPHVTQQHNWDCGLACSLMVLRHLNTSSSGFKETCKKLGFGESVWTIDLANLLQHYNVKSHLCTITMGVDQGYSKQDFYKSKFSADEIRVNRLFQDKEKLGLSAEERSVTLEEILDHLSRRQIAIVLIDWNVISRKVVGASCQCLPTSCAGKFGSVYQGHFVVVCGFSKRENLIYFHNPAVTSTDVCGVNVKSFEAARKSYGTDEDILFIYSD